MKHKRTQYGTMDKSSLDNRSVVARQYPACIVRNNWPNPPAASEFYSTGRLADEIQVNFEFSKLSTA